MPSADAQGMRLIEIETPEETAEAVADVLLATGAYGVFTEGLTWEVPGADVFDARQAASGPVRVRAAVPERGAEGILARVLESIRSEPSLCGLTATLCDMPEIDWVRAYEETLRAIELVPGIFAAPPWDHEPSRRELVMEPGAAFGFGDHATTRTALTLLYRHMRKGDDVIDLGCGTGVLGAVALMLGAGRARLYDIDALAAETARRTLMRNGLHGRVVHGGLPRRTRPADLMLANIAASALRPLLADIVRAIRPGGVLIAGGILADDATFREDLERAGLSPFDGVQEGDWQAIAARRR